MKCKLSSHSVCPFFVAPCFSDVSLCKSGSIKVSVNEASKRKEQRNLGQSNIKSFTTPASKLKSTPQHTPPTPPSSEDQKKKKSNG